VKSRSRLFAISAATACLAASLAASAAQAASPAWVPIAASGPTNLPPVQSEVQRLSVDAEGGTYTLTAHHAAGRGTGDLLSINATTIQNFQVKSGSFSVGQTIVGDFIASGTTITAIGANSLSLSKPATNGSLFETFGLEFFAVDASETTPPLPFAAEASQVAAALNALSTIGGVGGSVTVKGGPGDEGATSPYFVTYGGSLAELNLPELEADSSELSGGLQHTATVSTALDGGPGTTQIVIYAQNVGGVPSLGETTLSFTLPAGVETTATPKGIPAGGGPQPWACEPTGAGQGSVTCTSNSTYVAAPGLTLPPLYAPVAAGPGAASGVVHVEVSGGNTVGTATYDMPLIVSAIPAPPGLQSFAAGAYDKNGVIDDDAGAHPYSASAGILVNTVRSAKTGQAVPAGEFRDIVVDTPPGFLGNPIATAQCPEAAELKDCEHASIVAVAQVPAGRFGDTELLSPVNNIEAPFGYPAKFRFLIDGRIIINVAASLRSDEDYGLETGSYNTPQVKPVFGSFFTFWGTPADPGHDGLRCKFLFPGGIGLQCGPGGKEVAFLTNPVDCAEEALRPPVATLNVNTWQNPGLLFSHDVALEPVTECDKLNFEAGFSFDPDHARSDSPASFRTELTVPSEGLTEPDLLMTPTINESVVELPKGVVLNASAADGLAACSKEQIGLKGTDFPPPNRIRFTKDPNSCPDASMIGSGELKSELLADPLQGALYLAAQGEGNPFGSLFAIYLVIEDPRHGIFIKLPGEVQLNEIDGQQRIVFRDLPPLPFSYLRLNLKGGNRSPLATPTTCGNYLSTATNTPWSAPESGPPHVSGKGFQISQGPNGMPCAASEADRPFGIGLSAGSAKPVAGARSPFQIQVTRPDGNQELDRLEISPPPGFVASLRGIPYCAEAQIAAASGRSGNDEHAGSSCPSASQIGTTNAGAGSGPTPFYAPGRLYLSGPYKGAPLSVVAITPAVAGPFDLGNVVVRSALRIDPRTARITAATDPLPRIVKGVPLRIRDVRIDLDRPNWAQNPTSCEAMSVDLTAFGSNGATSRPSDRYQVGGCGKLGFKPRVALSLKGGTKRGAHPVLRAVVRPRRGDANIAAAAVTLPRSAFLDQGHIRTVCTRVQFAADACPKAAIYGRAEAITPLLDYPLSGPVYLRSSDNKLPDLVADLRGPAYQPIKIEASFRTDSIRGGIRSTLDLAPDAPVTKFTLQMQGGRKGLIVNSQNLCAKTNRARARFRGHNGRRHKARPKVVALNCKKQRKRGAKGRGGRR
jgi:hypothetical protein